MNIRGWTRQVTADLRALYRAARDRRTPRAARLVLFSTALYLISPIDAVPDVVPLFGMMDDLLAVPLGLVLAARLIPADILAFHRGDTLATERPPPRLGRAATMVAGCLLVLIVASWWGYGAMVA